MTRDEILALSDIKTEPVHIPEWQTTLTVRSLTGTERDLWEASNLRRKGDKYEGHFANLRARLVVLCVVNADGSRMFKDEDVNQIGQKNAAALDRIFEVARRLSGLKPEDVESLAKNSEPGQNGTSTSS